MPLIGEIRQGKDIGRYGSRFLWHACADCGHCAWVELRQGKPRNLRCYSCAKKGQRHPLFGRRRESSSAWKGGHYISGGGYMMILQPDHSRSNPRGYVKRAVLVLEEKLGRPMLDGTVPHHLNSIRDDDRSENLEEMLNNEHMFLHAGKRIRTLLGRFS